MHQVPNAEEAQSTQRRVSMSLLEQFHHFRLLRTRELRELLEDEDKFGRMIRCDEKFQGLQRAAEKILISNHTLAKASLSQKPKFRDAKLLLAVKYKELDKLRLLIQAKQEQLAKKYTFQSAQSCLLKTIAHAEEESELLFQSFAEGKMSPAHFMDSFLSSRKRHHIRVILVKELQDMIGHREKTTTHRLDGLHPEAQCFSAVFPEQIHNPCRPVCTLPTAVVLPHCCSPQFLPFSDSGLSVRYLPHLPFWFDFDDPRCPASHGQGPRRPAVPARLQPLKKRKDQQV